MKKRFIEILATVLCLAIFLTACGPAVAPEESPENESSDSSISGSSQEDKTSQISYPEWADELIWRPALFELQNDSVGYSWGEGPYTQRIQMQLEVYDAIKFSGDHALFIVAVRKEQKDHLDFLNIKYGPISHTDFVESVDNDPNDFIRAYVSREQISTLILEGVYVLLTVPERPDGYPETIADSLAFLMETSSGNRYRVIVERQSTYTLPPPRVRGIWDYPIDYDAKWEELTKEEILALAEDSDVCLIHLPYVRDEDVTRMFYRTDLQTGKLGTHTEWAQRVLRSEEDLLDRDLWDKDLQLTVRFLKLFGFPEKEIEKVEKESWENFELQYNGLNSF